MFRGCFLGMAASGRQQCGRRAPGLRGRKTAFRFPGCLTPAPKNYCSAAQNSTGAAARMGFQGTTSISQNNLRLHAQDCPPNQFGIFFHGTGQQYLPLGDGYLCVTPPINRLPVINTGAAGTPSWVLDLSSAGGATSGETWSFSFWFRDPPGGGGGPVGNNLSDGLSVFFCP